MNQTTEFQALYKKFAESGSLFMPPVLMEALLNKKNCSILLRVDKIVLAFINSHERQYAYASKNNYERLLAHQLCPWYGLQTESPHKACTEVIVRKPDNYTFPARRVPITQLIECVHEFQRAAELQRALAARTERDMQQAALKGLMGGLGMGGGMPMSAPPMLGMQAQQDPTQDLMVRHLMYSGAPQASMSAPHAAQLAAMAPLGLMNAQQMGGQGYPPMMQDPFLAAQQAQLEEALRMQGVRGIY